MPLVEISADNQPVHWAQAKVYGFMLATQEHCDSIDIQLTYLHIDTQETLEIRRGFTRTELEAFFNATVTDYLEWACTLQAWQAHRDTTIKQLAFPFENYRAGQREFAVAVYRAIAGESRLFAQAPTGIGKTVATVFPALKALGQGKIAKIFYLTAKTVGRTVAQDTLVNLAASGLRAKVLTLTAKEKICFLERPDCRPEACEHARGYFDRVRPALSALFEHDRFDRSTIEAVAQAHRVCPFEFALFASLFADVIIADYNYAFDPRVYLRRFFEPPTDAYTFLVDEAHNLPDRAREMFSAELLLSDFADTRKLIKGPFPGAARAIGKITPWFRRAAQHAVPLLPEADVPRNAPAANDRPVVDAESTPDVASTATTEVLADFRPWFGPGRGMTDFTDSPPALLGTAPPEELIAALRRFLKAADKVLADAEPSAPRDALLALFFKVHAFLRVTETCDERFVTYFDWPARDARLELFCVDPSALLGEALTRARSVVFFSATLLPMQYFVHILGGVAGSPAGPSTGDRVLALRSPFAAAQLGLFVLPGVRTTYRTRDSSHETIAEILQITMQARPGNYIAYFPSYKYMRAVRDVFTILYPEWPTREQEPGMSEEDRDRFLDAFAAETDAPLLGFAVMGGIFGEGIDLRGKRLIGAIVVGVGLPQICLERELIRDYFEKQANAGFAFAYRYPGMNRVMQAAGRVIRTERDRGVVLLLDERFTQRDYRSLFPPEWAHARSVAGKAALTNALATFWGHG